MASDAVWAWTAGSRVVPSSSCCQCLASCCFACAADTSRLSTCQSPPESWPDAQTNRRGTWQLFRSPNSTAIVRRHALTAFNTRTPAVPGDGISRWFPAAGIERASNAARIDPCAGTLSEPCVPATGAMVGICVPAHGISRLLFFGFWQPGFGFLGLGCVVL